MGTPSKADSRPGGVVSGVPVSELACSRELAVAAAVRVASDGTGESIVGFGGIGRELKM